MFMRPTTPEVHAERTPVEGLCPACATAGLQRYRVLSEGGWWNVVKCQRCLHSVSREPGPLFGTLTTAIQSLIPGRKER
jgi:vanillate/4-hydroxybenzoate decarboxylase subunit D